MQKEDAVAHVQEQEAARLRNEKIIRLKRLSRLLLSHAVAIFLGIALGWYGYEKLVLSFNFVDEAALVSRYAAYRDIRRASNTGTEHRNALLAYLNALEQAKRHPNRNFTERNYFIDKTIIYFRLSLIAKREGNEKESGMYLHQALTSCAHTGWQDCTKSRLYVISNQVEDAGLILNRD